MPFFLHKIIFSSSKNRLQLESLLHPIIWDEVQLQLKSITAPYCIIVVPLLLENITQIKAITFDRILVVDVPEEIQVERTESRDHCGNSMIQNIMKNQVSRKIRIAAADDIILNTDNLDSLNKEVEKLHKQYLKLSKQTSF